MRENPRVKPLVGDRYGLKIQATVFPWAAGIIVVFVAVSLMFLEQMSTVFDATQRQIAMKAGWFYVLSVNVFLGFVVYLMFSRYGSIRLGRPGEQPSFTYGGWFAMLFAAGMGIGLLFWSVAEPISHYGAPPMGEAKTVRAAELAMTLTFLHWGFHTWATYAVVGLALAFFAFNRSLPLTISSAFYPLIKDRIYGPWGHAIDVVATVATLFGLATSLGLGVKQVNAGLAHLFGAPQSALVQLVLIALITAAATISVVLGVERGIRRLSWLNMILAGFLLLFVLIVGPTLFLLNALIENIGLYLSDLLRLGLWTEAYQRSDWQKDWTLFYWGWWIGWSPFVGMFIARISRGRTVREFVLGVVLVPSLVTFAWLSTFGNAALYVEAFGAGGLVEAVEKNVAVALFSLLEQFPFAVLTSMLGMLVLAVFFVTSADSASLVVVILTAGGLTEPPRLQRVFWAGMQGVVAAVLLLGGGLQALRTVSISAGLPFAFVLLLMCVSLLKAFRDEMNPS